MHISKIGHSSQSLGNIARVSSCALLQGEQVFIELIQITTYIAMKRILKSLQILEGSGKEKKEMFHLCFYKGMPYQIAVGHRSLKWKCFPKSTEQNTKELAVFYTKGYVKL